MKIVLNELSIIIGCPLSTNQTLNQDTKQKLPPITK